MYTLKRSVWGTDSFIEPHKSQQFELESDAIAAYDAMIAGEEGITRIEHDYWLSWRLVRAAKLYHKDGHRVEIYITQPWKGLTS